MMDHRDLSDLDHTVGVEPNKCKIVPKYELSNANFLTATSRHLSCIHDLVRTNKHLDHKLKYKKNLWISADGTWNSNWILDRILDLRQRKVIIENMASLESLAEQFDELGIEPSPAILGKCLDLCTTYNITDPSEFVEQWIAFSVSHLNGAEPTLLNLNDLERKELSAKLKRDKHGAAAGTPSIALGTLGQSFECASPSAKVFGFAPSTTSDAGDDVMDSYISRTPKAPSARIQRSAAADSPLSCASPLSTKSTTSYTSGQVVYTFGNALLVKNASWASSRRQKITIHHVSPTSTEPTEARPNEVMQPNEKFMFEKLTEKCLLSADNLFDIGHQICLKMQANEDAAVKNGTIPADTQEEVVSVFDSLVYPDIASQQVVTCIGRICCDSETKIGPSSTILVSTDDTRLRSVRLNFSKMNSVALFAGQTVAVRGINARGDMLYVQEICAERQLTKAAVPKSLTDPLSILVVSGPYTLTDDLTYEPLHDVLTYCKENRPDVLIMMGPFVDCNHGMIIDGVLTESFDVFFEKLVVLVMESLGPYTQVIFVSSSQDVNCPPVYPTHPMKIKRSFPNLRFVSDPSVISVNGVTIAMTATDVISHLGEVEMTHNAGEKIRRAVNYLFNQGSFYPLNPSLDVNIDCEMASKFCTLKIVPNILLVPGDIKCYIRDINGCLVLNSGRLTDKKSRGTFARLLISPLGPDETNLFNYMACQVIKV